MPEPVEEETKRLILVGFLPPSKLERDVIYVQLRRENFNPNEVYVNAISNIPFNYIAYPFSVNQKDFTGKKAEDLLFKQPGKDYKYFLENLKRNNNADIVYNFEEEGLELTQKINHTKKLLKKVGRIFGS